MTKNFKAELFLMAFLNGRTVFMNTTLNPFNNQEDEESTQPQLVERISDLAEHLKKIENGGVANN
jgi:MORN repeat